MCGKLLTALAVMTIATAQSQSIQEIYRWNTTNIVFPSEEVQTRAYERNEYIPANNAIAGIKIWKDKMFLTIPRWKEGVPITLGVTRVTYDLPINETDFGPKIEAYPNWDMQEIGDCRAFQFVQSMEIDPMGRMWVLDTGRTETMTLQANNRCPPRLVILDIEKNGEILRSYNFPETVASPNASYLNDIVLDHEDGGFAYITDTNDIDPGIIVFSLRNRTSWKVRHPSMRAQHDAESFVVNKVHVLKSINVDGIALSPASATDRQVFYTPLSSFYLYSIPTSILKNGTEDVQPWVRDWGKKDSQSDGMMMSSSGVLYYGRLADDAIYTWDTVAMESSFIVGQRPLARDHMYLQWPDTFAFDEQGYIYCVTNSLQNFIKNRVDVKVPNYRVIRFTTPGAKSYQYYKNGTAPELPIIIAGAEKVSFPLSTFIVALLAFLMK